jgi:hypothetical protein
MRALGISAMKGSRLAQRALAELVRDARKPEQKARWLDWWHAEQLIFDLINERLGGRYKLELKDRSYAPGASKAGRPIKEYIDMMRASRQID